LIAQDFCYNFYFNMSMNLSPAVQGSVKCVS
jgi:hypothetical protein